MIAPLFRASFGKPFATAQTFSVIAIAATVLSGGLVGPTAIAQQEPSATAQYLNPALTPDVRARDLVGKMTLEEKASQLVNQSRAIPRLKVPAYDWWSESLHGVAVNGTTEYPEPIGLAATFTLGAQKSRP